MIQGGSDNFSKLKPVGIVVTSSKESGEVLHPCMRTLEQDLSAIEKSIYECALAGCSSVWVCCTEDFQPIIKKHVGDYIKDPVSISKASFTKHPSENTTDIPIYYYLVHPKDRLRRSGQCWDIFSTALTIYYISRKVSRWSIPSNYYVSFCNSVYDISQLRDYRNELSRGGNIMFQMGDLTALDDLSLGVSGSGETIKEIISGLKREKIYHKSEDLNLSSVKKFFDLESYKKIKISEYFTCYKWENYVEYIKNNNFSFNIKKQVFFNLKSKGIIND
jgi:hypothetical protein